MQKFNGALTADSYNKVFIGKVMNVAEIDNIDDARSVTYINCEVIFSSDAGVIESYTGFEGTTSKPIIHTFIDCNVSFRYDTFSHYRGEVHLKFIGCKFTSSNALYRDIQGDGYSEIYLTNCEGQITVGTNDSTEIPIFYVSNSPNLTVKRSSSTYQYADIYLDGEIEIYNKNSGYTSLNGAGAQYSWCEADDTPASVIANGIEPGYYVTGFRFGQSKRIAVHYNAVVDVGDDTYYYFENEVICDIDGDFNMLGYIRGATVPRLMSADATTPTTLNMTFRVLSNRVDFLGAEYEGYTSGTPTLASIHIDKIRGIL